MVNHTTRYVPIKPSVSFDFNDWLAGLLARPGNEKKMADIWTGIHESSEVMKDVFHGSLLREFLGPDKKTHFSVGSDDKEGRYVFSLGFDFFNPLTNKQGGKKLSVGALLLVCLNLPPYERYKPENMFLAGIIPGPKEPALDSLNSYLIPIVDSFEKLWRDGVQFTKTHDLPSGRLVRCAIVAVICDLPAAKKIGGFASCKHEHFCSICWCQKHVTVKKRAPDSKKTSRKGKTGEDETGKTGQNKEAQKKEQIYVRYEALMWKIGSCGQIMIARSGLENTRGQPQSRKLRNTSTILASAGQNCLGSFTLTHLK